MSAQDRTTHSYAKRLPQGTLSSGNMVTSIYRTGIIVMGLLSAFLAACTGASAQWSRQKQTTHQLDEVATMAMPQNFVARPDESNRTPDYSTYYFRRTYKSHLNGQTSYAEEMTVVLLAPDLPRERLERMLTAGDFSGMGRDPGMGQADENGRHWLVREITYERHPVTEPSLLIRVDDAARGMVVTWRGFKKEYSVEDAKKNLSALLSSISVSPKLADDFATRRSWARSGWESAYAANTKAAREVLAEFKLTLPSIDSMSRQGKWRVYLDDLRPQQLHIVHELPSITLPDAPFRIIEPVTYFKYMQKMWFQDNQGQESDRLPLVGQKLLAPEFVDQERVYFYQMSAVDMWKTYTGPNEFAELLRKTIKDMMEKNAKLLKNGFIAGDAEP